MSNTLASLPSQPFHPPHPTEDDDITGPTRLALVDALVQQLARLGYRLVNEAPGLWFWEVGDTNGANVDGTGFASDDVALPFDSPAEAALAALEDLTSRARELVDAARGVIRSWPTSDLAEAVRELDRSARMFGPDLS